MALHVGTSGWSYPIWKPAFFPEKLPQKKFLEYYSTQLNAVELNATFRRFASATALQNWIASTTPDFSFAAKAHQVITHFRRLKEADDPLRRFLESLDPLRRAGKLGPILFQTPPNLKADTVLLQNFVQLLPEAYRFAFEFRHDSWFTDAVFEILKSRNAALCWAESEKIASPHAATADFLYYRFREPEYSAAELRKVAEELTAQAHIKEVFAFFKHEESPESALNAVTVARAAGLVAHPYVLPEPRTKKAAKPPR
jgi:uncharacterized protein YecE (DUF72 family)